MNKSLSQILDEFKEIKSTRKELKEFGIVMGIFFALLVGLALWKGRPFLLWTVLSGSFFLSAFAFPKILKPLQKIWMGFAVVMGYLMSRVILFLVFFIAVTPISLCARLAGKKFLDLDFKKDKDSYWIPKNTDIPRERYEKQF